MNVAMKVFALGVVLLVAGCQSGGLLDQGDGEAASGVPAHTADPAGEPAASLELPEGSSSEAISRLRSWVAYPPVGGRKGFLYEGIRPQPWLKSASNWFPRTEDVQPNEMRIIFMGTAPFIRPGQMNTSIFVQLGNGENFVFDIGEGSIANYISRGLRAQRARQGLHHALARRSLRCASRTSRCLAVGLAAGTRTSRSTAPRDAHPSTVRRRWSRG